MKKAVVDRISILIIVVFSFLEIFYLRPPFSPLKPSEPYPALLLPAGEQLFHDYGLIHYSHYKIEVISQNGQLKTIPIDKLLDTIPLSYREKVVWNNFGVPDSIPKNPNPKVKEGLQWLRKKSKTLTGFNSIDHIKILYLYTTKNMKNNGKSEKIINTKKIYLN